MSDSWAACGGLPGVRPGSVSECSHYTFGKNVWNECRVSWGLGYIRCTGRYDNISFIIKTPYFKFCVFALKIHVFFFSFFL